MSKTADLIVRRQERKYLLDIKERIELIPKLDALLTPDAYGSYDGYRVRSIYFDSKNNHDFVERERKFNFVKRIRLRAYTPEDEVAKFEFKRKWRNQGDIKESVIVSRADALEMIEGNFEVLKNYDSPVAEMGYEICSTMDYRPVSVVEYKRRAYTHTEFETRITLDNELKYRNNDFRLFSDDNDLFISALPLRYTILEVKYDRFLFPQLQSVLRETELNGCPVSKFASSRSTLLNYYS